MKIALQGMCYTMCKMTAKLVENSMGITAKIKARSLLCHKPVDIHREVCDIYEEGHMSHRYVCMWVAKSIAGQQDLKDAARLGHPPTTNTKSNIKKTRCLFKKQSSPLALPH